MDPFMVVTVGTFETSVLVLVFCGEILALVVGAVVVDVLVVVVDVLIVVVDVLVVVVDVLVLVVDVLIVVIGITKKYRIVQNY